MGEDLEGGLLLEVGEEEERLVDLDEMDVVVVDVLMDDDDISLWDNDSLGMMG